MQIDGEKMETVTDFIFLGSNCRWWLQPWNEKTLAPWKKSCDKPRQHIKKQRHYFEGSKITADGDCSHEIKRRLLLGRKVMINLNSILKSGDITWSRKVHLVKAMVFLIVMYGCESGTIKKAEHWKMDAFELQCWINSWEFLGQQGDQTNQS